MTARLGELFETLTPDEQVAVVTLVEAGGPVELDYLGVELRLHQPHGAHPQRVVSELERRGLVARLGDGRYRIPPLLLPELTQRALASRQVTDADLARQERPPGDFHRALLLLRFDADPPRRKKGRGGAEVGLFKADADRLVELFGDALGGAAGVESVVRSLLGQRLLREKDDLLVVNLGRARAWAALSPAERALLELSDTFCHRPYLGHVLDRLIAEPTPAGGGWVSQSALAGHYRRLRFQEVGRWSPPTPEFLSEDFGEVERKLRASPLVIVGHLRHGTLAYRLCEAARDALLVLRAAGSGSTAAAEPAAERDLVAEPVAPRARSGPSASSASAGTGGSCHVQASFEVIVPPEISLGALLDLGRVAEVIRLQTVATLRITPERVKTSAARGSSSAELLDIVRGVARHAVPEAVEHEIVEWAGGGTRVEFVEAFLLRVEPARAEELRADKRLQPYLLAELGPGLFAVDPARRQAISRVLAAWGLRPQPTVVRFPAEDGSSPAEEGQLVQELAWAGHLLSWRAAGGDRTTSSPPAPPPPLPSPGR